MSFKLKYIRSSLLYNKFKYSNMFIKLIQINIYNDILINRIILDKNMLK